MRILESHCVPSDIKHQRIYDYCLDLFYQLPSRKSVKKAIERGEVRLNERSTSTGFWLKGGEIIELIDLENTPPKIYKLPLDVVYEDAFIAIVNKPAGLLTSGNAFKTVTNALSFNLTKSTEKDALAWPITAHRLDKATSGLLLIAKTKTARMVLGQQFERLEISKTYHAIVLGSLKGSGTIKTAIEGKNAITDFEVLSTSESLRYAHLSLVKLMPKTGRKHQLRIHLSSGGNAILGDSIYSPDHLLLKHKGLFLSATKISLQHPILKVPLEAEISIPQKFTYRVDYEKKRHLKTKSS